MERRRMENIGAEPSMLGFGCMRFPTLPDGKINEAEAEKMLDYALAHGVTYIDTAYFYHDGASEPFVGRVLEKYARDSFYLATKMPTWILKDAEDAKRVFQDQLARLRTDYIDFYLLHTMDQKKWQAVLDMGILPVLEELKKEGKIRYLGFSFHDEYEVFEEILTYRKWDFCQIQLNYMDTEEQAGMKGYQLAEKLGIPMVIMEPVRGGALAGFSPEMNQRFYELDEKASVASYALRFVGSLPNVKVILSGMSSMEQVEDNIHTFSPFQPLNEAEKNVIGQTAAELKARIQNGCTGCRYCMPCPHGVDIPGNFKIWNTYHMYRKYESVRFPWEGMKEERKPKNCVECGKCEVACPQKIPIREHLKRVQADLDGRIWDQ